MDMREIAQGSPGHMGHLAAGLSAWLQEIVQSFFDRSTTRRRSASKFHLRPDKAPQYQAEAGRGNVREAAINFTRHRRNFFPQFFQLAGDSRLSQSRR